MHICICSVNQCVMQICAFERVGKFGLRVTPDTAPLITMAHIPVIASISQAKNKKGKKKSRLGWRLFPISFLGGIYYGL